MNDRDFVQFAPLRRRRYHRRMPWIFVFIIIVVALTAVGAPIADGIARRLAKPDLHGGGEDLDQLRTELDRTTQRLEDTERRLMLAEERLDFQEKLLTSRSSVPPS
jgi:hypothetical protein